MKGNDGKREHTVVSYSKKPTTTTTTKTSLLDRAWRINTATTTREAAAAGELLDQGGRDGSRHFVRAIKGRLTLVLRISVCHVNYAPKNE